MDASNGQVCFLGHFFSLYSGWSGRHLEDAHQKVGLSFGEFGSGSTFFVFFGLVVVVGMFFIFILFGSSWRRSLFRGLFYSLVLLGTVKPVFVAIWHSGFGVDAKLRIVVQGLFAFGAIEATFVNVEVFAEVEGHFVKLEIDVTNVTCLLDGVEQGGKVLVTVHVVAFRVPHFLGAIQFGLPVATTFAADTAFVGIEFGVGSWIFQDYQKFFRDDLMALLAFDQTHLDESVESKESR